eukprot:4610845-Prymnesium_polylepis.2
MCERELRSVSRSLARTLGRHAGHAGRSRACAPASRCQSPSTATGRSRRPPATVVYQSINNPVGVAQ